MIVNLINGTSSTWWRQAWTCRIGSGLINEIGVKDDDLQLVKTCFQLSINLNTTLDNMTNEQLQEYKGRIEGARAIDQVAAITLDYMPEYLVLQDSINTHWFAI